VFRIDMRDALGKADLLTRVARALSFPDWFGANWDSLHDCLTDLDWLPAKTGYVLLFENCKDFGTDHKQDFEDASAVLDAAAEYWKAERRPFWVFFEAPEGWDSAGLKRL